MTKTKSGKEKKYLDYVFSIICNATGQRAFHTLYMTFQFNRVAAIIRLLATLKQEFDYV